MWKVVDNNVIPEDDIRDHEESNQCWCNPDYDEGIYIHHSLDNRELTENLIKS